ncbi:MAG: hypothetical protein HW380_1782 [Magnetococcales bacterium]|nr:hypothetical protein [Magnetococcales bacterium]
MFIGNRFNIGISPVFGAESAVTVRSLRLFLKKLLRGSGGMIPSDPRNSFNLGKKGRDSTVTNPHEMPLLAVNGWSEKSLPH